MENKCKHINSYVIDTRMMEGYRRRRYECVDCDHRWSTIEIEYELTKGRSSIDDVISRIKGTSGLTPRQESAVREIVDIFIS